MNASHNLFGTLQEFELGTGRRGQFYSLPALEKAGVGPVSRLPVSIRLVLESVLRNCDGKKVFEANVRELANWKPRGRARRRSRSSSRASCCRISPACRCWWIWRPCAAPSPGSARIPKSSSRWCRWIWSWTIRCRWISPEAPDSMAKNLDLEFTRNRERYQFLKWGMQAFDTFKVVPPGIGIVHQVNLEYLAKGVLSSPSPELRDPHLPFTIPTPSSARIRIRR